MSRSLALLATCVAVAVATLASCTAHAGTVTLGSGEMRSVELAKDVDAGEWAERNGVEPMERVPLAGGGAIVRFAMDDGVWRARNAAMCTDNGVLSCGTDYCQTYFVPQQEPAPAAAPAEGNARAGVASGEDATTEVDATGEEDEEVRLELRLIETDDDADQRTGIDATVVAEDGLPLAGARVLLVPRAPSVESLFAAEAQEAFDPAKVAGQRSCAKAPSASKLLTALTSDKGSFAFPDAGSESVDRGCWEVVTAAACQARTQPLSDVLPEREPRRLLAVASLAGKDGKLDPKLLASFSQLPGMTVLETSVLASISRALVRFEISDEAMDPQSALGALRGLAGVENAQHEYRYRTAAQFNDPYAWMNYGARLTGADRLLAATAGAGVRIAVIDSGVDDTHPELAARIAERIDVTGYGLSADRHGTAVAGLIAAEANNNVGAFGMAPSASLVAIKACEPESRNAVVARCWSSTIAKALDAALARDVAIINMSISGPRDPLVASLIDAALAKQRLVVAAAGNGGPDAAPSFPAAHPGVIAVTAIDTKARLYTQATRGQFVDLAAPGVEVPVPVPGSTYPGQLSGTSMASAHVSGVAALLLSASPDAAAPGAAAPAAATPEAMKNRAAALRDALESTAVSLASGASDTRFGRGRIDGCAAARALGQPESCAAAPESSPTAQPPAAQPSVTPPPATQPPAPPPPGAQQ